MTIDEGICILETGTYSGLCPVGGSIFWGRLSTSWGSRKPENPRFHGSRGRTEPPEAPPPEYTSDYEYVCI